MKSNLFHYFCGLPVRRLLRLNNYRPSDSVTAVAYELVNGSDQFSESRSESFLTHSTPLEGQIRFPLQDRVNRSLKAMATDFKKSNPVLPFSSISLNSRDYISIHFFRYLDIVVRTIEEPHFVSPFIQGEPASELLSLAEQELAEGLEDGNISLDTAISFARKKVYSCDYQTALNILSAVAERTSRADVHHLKGLCHNFFGETVFAEESFKMMLKHGSPEAQANAGYVLSMLYLRLHPSKLQSLSKAEDFLENAYALLLFQPATEEIQFLRIFNRNGYALCLFRRGQILEAAQLLEDGIKKLRAFNKRSHDLHQSVLLYNALQCYRALQQFEMCERITEDLMELDPLFPEYHLEHGRTLLEQDRVLEARQKFIDAIQLDEFIAEAHALKAYTYVLTEDYVQASRDYEKAATLRPDSHQFQEDLAYCREEMAL